MKKSTPSTRAHILATILIAEASIASAFFLATGVQFQSRFHAEITTSGMPIDIELCGNWDLEPSNNEQCDEGPNNGVESDGLWCSINCQKKLGRTVTTGDDPYCGDGTKDEDEGCDEGTNNSNTTPNACRTSCEPASCGDGVRDNGEECDDGNTTNNDSCTNACKNQRCGDGITQASNNEQCDDGNADNADGCTNTCKNPICGDGIKQESRGEQCDDSNTNNNDGCDSICKIERCGDGKKQEQEECDEGDSKNNDSYVCKSDCKKARCGDGIKQELAGEACDEGSRNGNADSACTAECKVREVKPPDDDTTGGGGGNGDEDEGSDTIGGGGGNGDEDEGSDTIGGGGGNGDEDEGSDTLGGGGGNGDEKQDTTGGGGGNKNQNTENPVIPKENVVRPAAPTQPTTTTTTSREAEQNKLKEAMRKAREAAGLQTQTVVEEKKEEGTTPETERPDVHTSQEEEPEEDSGLRCFDSAGNLVSKRSECDHKQERIMLQRQEVVSEVAVKEDLRKKLLGDNIAEQKRANLLETLRKARTQLEKISKINGLDDEARQYFADAIQWIDRGITYFSTGDRSIEEIQQMADPVRQLVGQATALVMQQRNLPSVKPDINPIITKTELLLQKFRESFIALAQNNVQLDSTALEKYTEAANLFANVKMLCLEDNDQCSHISDVLEILKTVQGPLLKQLEENPEIYKRIQAKFEQ